LLSLLILRIAGDEVKVRVYEFTGLWVEELVCLADLEVIERRVESTEIMGLWV